MFSKSFLNQFLFFLYLLISIKCYYIKEGHVSSKIITNFTFGSNYYGRNSESGDIFAKINEHNPNLFIWLGNAVYLDQPKFNYFRASPKTMDFDMIRVLYKKVKENEFYTKLNKKTPIIGTWGDEEYGVINGDKENIEKEAFKQYYLDFLDADSVDFRRHDINLGIYSTYTFGKRNKVVRFIVLDLKYDQDSFLKKGEKDMLGEHQWTWLENIFKKSNEALTFICAPNQILTNDRFIMKKWYAESRKRLFDLIGKYKKSGVIFLTGGLGFSQILKTFCPLEELGYNLYEFSSSGLGHTNKIGNFWNNFYHNDYLIEGTNYNDINFGQIKINWGEKDIKDTFLEFEIIDKNDKVVSNVIVNYTEIMYKENSSDYYQDENNLKEINYMNIHDGESCKREIYHRVRTPYMVFKYYSTHFKHLPEAIITIIVIVLSTEILLSKRFYYIFIFAFVCFLIYCAMFCFDLFKYNNFRKNIIENN